jgi:hypothetical protein
LIFVPARAGADGWHGCGGGPFAGFGENTWKEVELSYVRGY